jgi:hypothetical protein
LRGNTPRSDARPNTASPGCTPPYARVWIAEMVRRREEMQGAKSK